MIDSSSSIGVLFFFQAEDGIRDIGVTGVQTCALPISVPEQPGFDVLRPQRLAQQRVVHQVDLAHGQVVRRSPPRVDRGKSEERRGGKECKSRRQPYHLKKKKTQYKIVHAISYL